MRNKVTFARNKVAIVTFFEHHIMKLKLKAQNSNTSNMKWMFP